MYNYTVKVYAESITYPGLHGLYGSTDTFEITPATAIFWAPYYSRTDPENFTRIAPAVGYETLNTDNFKLKGFLECNQTSGCGNVDVTAWWCAGENCTDFTKMGLNDCSASNKLCVKSAAATITCNSLGEGKFCNDDAIDFTVGFDSSTVGKYEVKLGKSKKWPNTPGGEENQ